MKTISDLNALIPTIMEQFKNADHEYGELYIESSEDGCGICCDPVENFFCYDEDGWDIEISYDCEETRNGNWRGEVTEIGACHYDRESGEQSEFYDADCAELKRAVNEYLA